MKPNVNKTSYNFSNFKGFTLIELLAIIVILGIVALITVPIIIDIINNGRKDTFKNSAKRMLEAANTYYVDTKLEGKYFEELTFTVQDGKMKSGDYELSFNGKMPIGDSYVKINEYGQVEFNITDGVYRALKEYGSGEITYLP